MNERFRINKSSEVREVNKNRTIRSYTERNDQLSFIVNKRNKLRRETDSNLTTYPFSH